jgi:hypothetical protein
LFATEYNPWYMILSFEILKMKLIMFKAWSLYKIYYCICKISSIYLFLSTFQPR